MTRFPNRAEFVLLISSVSMLIAFAIDAMLPALPAIGASLSVTDPTRWALVITAFTLGFGISQLVMGTLSDRYGRRYLLLAALMIYSVTAAAAALAPSFEMLLLIRLLQGFGAAGARVIAVSIVRDRYEGRDMAQIMSLTSAVFMGAPIVAPFLGTAVLAIGPWRWIFYVLAELGLIVFVWAGLRLPESLPADARRAINPRAVLASARIVLGDRLSVGYAIASGCLTAVVMGFLTSVTLIFSDTFKRPDLLPYGFAIMAGSMMAASFANAAVVKRLGTRLLGHASVLAMTGFAAAHVAIVAFAGDELVLFVVLQSAMMCAFALAAGNFNAMSMENMGAVAGTASSLQGAWASVFGSIGGAIVGWAFDGTTMPLYIGATLFGCIAIAAVLWAERGRLFVAEPQVQGA